MELLKQMLETLSVSGNEENLADLIEKEIAPDVDEIRRDVMGNLIAFKKGAGEAPKKMMLSAHMDEIGMIITHAEEDGYLRFANVGGLRIPFLVGQPVIFKNGVRGNVMYETKIDFPKLKLENLYIDIGAETAEEALSMVSIGDVCAPYGTLFELGEHRVCGKPMDDKVACYIQIEAIKKLKNTVYILPEDVVKDSINASMCDGVLCIELPRKSPEAKNNITKVIEIK